MALETGWGLGSGHGETEGVQGSTAMVLEASRRAIACSAMSCGLVGGGLELIACVLIMFW
jgi:hypothetical protein